MKGSKKIFMVTISMFMVFMAISCNKENKKGGIDVDEKEEKANLLTNNESGDKYNVIDLWEKKEISFVKWLENPGNITSETVFLNYREAILKIKTEKPIFKSEIQLFVKNDLDDIYTPYAKVHLRGSSDAPIVWGYGYKGEYNTSLISKHFISVGPASNGSYYCNHWMQDPHSFGYIDPETNTVAHAYFQYLLPDKVFKGKIWVNLKAQFEEKTTRALLYYYEVTESGYPNDITGFIKIIHENKNFISDYPYPLTFEFRTPATPQVFWNSGILSYYLSESDHDNIGEILSFINLSPLKLGVDTSNAYFPCNNGWYQYGGSGSNLHSNTNILFSSFVTASDKNGKIHFWLNGVGKKRSSLYGNHIIFKKPITSVSEVRIRKFVLDDDGLPIVIVLKNEGLFIGNRLKSWYYEGSVTNEAKKFDEVFSSNMGNIGLWTRVRNRIIGIGDGKVLIIKYARAGNLYRLVDTKKLYNPYFDGAIWIEGDSEKEILGALVAVNNKLYFRWAYADNLTDMTGQKYIDIPDHCGYKDAIFKMHGNYLYILSNGILITYKWEDSNQRIEELNRLSLEGYECETPWIDIEDNKLVITSWQSVDVASFFNKYKNYKLDKFVTVMLKLTGHVYFEEFTNTTEIPLNEFVEKVYSGYYLKKLKVRVFDISQSGIPFFKGENENADTFYYPERLYYPGPVTGAYFWIKKAQSWTGKYKFSIFAGLAERPFFTWLDSHNIILPSEYFYPFPDQVLQKFYISQNHWIFIMLKEKNHYPVFFIFPNETFQIYVDYLLMEPLRFREEFSPLVYHIP